MSTAAATAGSVRIEEGDVEHDIGPAIEYFRDASNSLSVVDVQELPFQEHGNSNLSFGFTSDSVWLRFNLEPKLGSAKEWVLEVNHPLLDRVELFSPQANKPWRTQLAGDVVDKQLRDLDLRAVAFSISLKANQNQTFYLRIDSGSSIVTPVRLVEKSTYFNSTAAAETGLGLFFGGLLIMALFNLALYATMRDSTYLLYSLAVITTTLFQATLTGHAPHYLWPTHAQWSNPMSLAALIGALTFGMWFSIRFLDTRRNAPSLHWIMIGLIVASLGLAPLYFIAGYSKAISLGAMLSVICGLTGLIAGIWCLRGGVYSAKFYVLARTGFCIGTVLTAGRQLGLFPDSFLTENGMRIGSLLESVLLAFALSDRYNLLRAEKDAALKQTADELRRLDKLKDEILANTSHELRTPLQGIIGLSESMIDGAAGQLSTAAKDNLSMMVSSGKRLSRLVDDILDFSKLKTHELRLDTKPVDLRVAVEVVVTLLQPLVKDRQVKLINDIGTEFPTVLADESRLQQILSNLVGNAIKFTDEGEIRIQARENKQGDIQVDIIDTGIGIAEEAQPRIFESFQQGEGSETRLRGGTGLGLSVTKQLVELQGGEISFESKQGFGSTFSFTLAKTDQVVIGEEVVTTTRSIETSDTTDSEEINIPSNEISIAASDDAQQLRILVVDDEPINQQVLSNHLSLAKYSVTQALNGAQALELIKTSEKFDLVLLDVMMPNMSGYEVCERIRKTHMATELPIIMVTAKTQSEDLVTGLTAGANDYIAKPFSKQELMARIKTHLGLLEINTAYGNFLPREFLLHLGKQSIIDVDLGDNVELDISVMWSDIRGFTTILESMTPAQSFDFINGYFGRMGPVIRNHDGFINSFIGDAIMALFVEGPNSAVAAAVASAKRLDEYNQDREQQGRDPIVAGFAVHLGVARLGVVGEPQRRQGEVFSNAINMTSRIESLTKIYGSRVIISADVQHKITPGKYSVRRLDRVLVKGAINEIELYEVLNDVTDQDLKEQSRDLFETALVRAQSGDYAEAAKGFASVLELNPNDKAARHHYEQATYNIDVA